MTDIVCTWPKSSSLASYLRELEAAEQRGEMINFRVSALPTSVPARCYMVHDGVVRCWSLVHECVYRDYGQVRDRAGGYWPGGYYIVRWPDYHLTEPYPMKGFQGFRYFDRSLAPDR